MTDVVERDLFAVARAVNAPPPLREFNDAGVLAAADVHVARRLAAIGGESEPDVLLAVALAVRAPRVADAYANLATIHETALPVVAEEEVAAPLPWPAPAAWLDRVAASPLVAVGEDAAEHDRPLRLVGSALYLDRYWRDERQIAGDLLAFAAEPAEGVDDAVLADGLGRLFPAAREARQRQAAEAAVRRRFAVVAGGPGTGKTTTVARIAALLVEQAAAAGTPPPLIGLAAPTAKAAARLGEAVREQAAALDVDAAVAERVHALQAMTLHRLLGRRRATSSRFWHDRGNRLPYDVVIVDETSMVSLTLMARLLDAVRPDARLVLVGDPGQLVAIEVGAVLGDIVGPAGDDEPGEQTSPIAPGVVVLDEGFRFGTGVAALADAIRRGAAGEALTLLHGGLSDVVWIPDEEDVEPIRAAAVAAGRRMIDAAAAGDAPAALDALASFRVLCAHRRGDHGVSVWTERVEGWLAGAVAGFRADGPWYVGRPLLVTENDYGLRLFNGDTGVVVATEAGVTAAFDRPGREGGFHPSRLAAVDTVYAMTIHKSQGSQFDTAAVVLPDPSSRLLSRELLYTAVTRAKERLIVTGSEEAVRAAIERPIARASGLRARLWR